MDKRCKDEYECDGNCWLNVAGGYDIWDAVSNKCKGTLKEQKMNDDYFYGRVKEEELFKFHGLEVQP